MDTIVTVRCSNPTYNPATQVFMVDVEFKCDVPNQKLYGMNVRFLYDKYRMLFRGMTGFVPGYKQQVAPRPTEQKIDPRFGFMGMTHFINAAMVLNAKSLAPYLDGWTKLFQLSFDVTNKPDQFCPPIVWDKKLTLVNEPDQGGMISPGGVCITLQDLREGYEAQTICTRELVEQFNWVYTSSPFGHPVNINCI